MQRRHELPQIQCHNKLLQVVQLRRLSDGRRGGRRGRAARTEGDARRPRPRRRDSDPNAGRAGIPRRTEGFRPRERARTRGLGAPKGFEGDGSDRGPAAAEAMVARAANFAGPTGSGSKGHGLHRPWLQVMWTPSHADPEPRGPPQADGPVPAHAKGETRSRLRSGGPPSPDGPERPPFSLAKEVEGV